MKYNIFTFASRLRCFTFQAVMLNIVSHTHKKSANTYIFKAKTGSLHYTCTFAITKCSSLKSTILLWSSVWVSYIQSLETCKLTLSHFLNPTGHWTNKIKYRVPLPSFNFAKWNSLWSNLGIPPTTRNFTTLNIPEKWKLMLILFLSNLNIYI